MKEKILAVYERESTLWKNANGFYHAQDWTKMECKIIDYSEEINNCINGEFRWFDKDGNDVTEQQIEKLYGKPYVINLINKRRTNSKTYSFKTKEEANMFFIRIMNDNVLKNFKRIK